MILRKYKSFNTVIIILFLALSTHLFASEDKHGSHDEHAEESSEFNANEFIMDHIADSHEFHILTTSSGKHVGLPLPIIVYSKSSGLNIFMSSHLAHGHSYKGFELGHGSIVLYDDEGNEKEKSIEGVIIERLGEGEHAELSIPVDFSITRVVFSMFLSAVIILWLFIGLARSYAKTGLSEPKGIQGFLEPLILFVRDDIAKVTIGEEKHERFMPYLLTVFFFIWINNLIGIIPFFPFGSNVTGNIAVTFVLSLFTFFITQLSGTRSYWKHVVAMPGVPVWLYPIMIPIEIVGLFSKPFALMVRLFANITAGHIIILSLISLIFIFKSIFIAPGSVVFVLFMDMIELLVAVLQAYVFTLLSALFIGLAVKEGGH